MKKIYLVLFLLSISNLYGGNLNISQLDSLYNLFVSRRTTTITQQRVTQQEPIKCGFGLASTIRENLNSFSIEQQIVLRKILARPVKQTSIVTPGGFFRIHYDTTGSAVPNYDNLGLQQSLSLLATALDSAYNFEIGYLGYPPPPADNAEGGDNLFDIYVENLEGEGIYGETIPENSLGDNKYTSYIRIDNDYNGYPTKGIGGAQVTVAHEFHHTIQIGNYILRDSDIYFYEITSTAMEDFVYTTVNDYYNYLRDYFNFPNKAFAQYDGYELAIWNLFLKAKYGFDIIKQQWELMPKMRALQAIQNSLVSNGTTFGNEYNEFGIWTYFTKYRADLSTKKYFDEGENYPLLKAFTTIPINSSIKTVNISAMATSNYLINFVNPDNADTLSAIITNGDYTSGIDSLKKLFSAEYDLSNTAIDGGYQLDDNYFAKLTTDKPIYWYSSEILNNLVIHQGAIFVTSSNYVYPNPFFYEKNQFINIPLNGNNNSNVDLNVYSTGMELVYSSSVVVKDGKIVQWNGKGNSNNKLASGVYIYAIKNGSETITGKVVIFNE